MLSKIIISLFFAASVSANHWEQFSACKDSCSQLGMVVGSCVQSLNETFSVSVNTGNIWESFQVAGNLSDLGNCACSSEAVQVSSECLACVSENLCLDVPFTMQDYYLVCQDPAKNGMELFQRYHSKIAQCSVSSSSTDSSSVPASSSDSSSCDSSSMTMPMSTPCDSMTSSEMSSSSSSDCETSSTPLSIPRKSSGYRFF